MPWPSHRWLASHGGRISRGSEDQCDACIVIGDGLSALAIERHAAPLLVALQPLLPSDWKLAPLIIATQARVALAEQPEDTRARILEMQEKVGFMPSVFLALARRSTEWRAFFAYHDALMLKEEGSLTKVDREMIVTATSAVNRCLYCVVAHGALLRIHEKKPLVAVNWRKADITPRQYAMLEFAMNVCERSHEIEEADFPPLHAHGFSDEDIWDITAIFGLSNRMASFSDMPPNAEFYLMGRVPREKNEKREPKACR